MSRVAVITGASAGVGRAAVRRFARKGWSLGLLARGRDGLEGARREVEAAGGRAVAVTVDVADAEAVEAAAEEIEERLGPIDAWVNDAMVTVFAPVHEISPEDFRRVTEVNYLGAVHGTLAALRRMRPRDRGTIVQVGSALAYRAIPLQSAYCAGKFALRGFTDSLRTELLHEGSRVHVTSVHLPALNTPQFGWSKTTMTRQPQPVPPIYQPEVAADAIYFAATHRRREVRVGWPAVKVIVGNKLVPGLADRYLAATGFGSQLTDEPIDPQTRAHNLHEPVPGDHGAHGMFDDRAKPGSLQLELTKRRGWLLAAAGALAAIWLAWATSGCGDEEG